jgi:hypothetical protein
MKNARYIDARTKGSARLTDECLNQHWFRNLTDARQIVAEWREDYNQVRPIAPSAGYRPRSTGKRSIK